MELNNTELRIVTNKNIINSNISLKNSMIMSFIDPTLSRKLSIVLHKEDGEHISIRDVMFKYFDLTFQKNSWNDYEMNIEAWELFTSIIAVSLKVNESLILYIDDEIVLTLTLLLKDELYFQINTILNIEYDNGRRLLL